MKQRLIKQRNNITIKKWKEEGNKIFTKLTMCNNLIINYKYMNAYYSYKYKLMT